MTEIIPFAGNLRCVGGHGRLEWRANTFFEEEPQTIAWLDKLTKTDILWDIGANVGLYSIYAADRRGCRVTAFEPESQNYALLCHNIDLNNVNGLVKPASIALGRENGVSAFQVREISQGIAWSALIASPKPEHTFTQLVGGYKIDSLTLVAPTHIKIDVDGTEADVIAGAENMLFENRVVKSLLIELDPTAPSGRYIRDRLDRWDYREVSWERNASVTDPVANPSVNYVFERR